MPVYLVNGDLFQQALPSHSGGPFSARDTSVFCLYYLQHSFDKHMAQGILQFIALGQNSVLVASVEAVIKTCYDIM